MRKIKLKNLIWLVEHKEEIEAFLKKTENGHVYGKNYSTAGVPDFQKDFVNDLLSGKLKESK